VTKEDTSAFDVDLPTARRELEESLPGMAAPMEPENPGMHTTDTIDCDTVVQNGTRHAVEHRRRR
jgi:hypothetical protein